MTLPSAWTTEPTITALSDAPIKEQLADNDKFRLTRTMGPVLDILRHKNTQTPLSVAVYGTWGSGKSTAMHWLAEGLEEWNSRIVPLNDDIPDTDHHWPHVLPVNFYPWKYSTKEDVWRGLIVEIILACIKHRDSNSKTIGEVISKFSGFLGSKLTTALSALKLKGELMGVKGEIDVKQLIKVFENEDISPETAYLNAFEHTFEKWVGEFIKPTDNEWEGPKQYRLVVFIDDLDRCLPDVALQVLEALKLYLNIPGLVFVLGLDESVVKQQIKKYYKDLGVGEEKSKYYLAKMFQVEVTMDPHEGLVSKYVKQLISEEEWRSLGIDPNGLEKDIFINVIRHLGEHSPRETKRLVNSTLMQARGAQMILKDFPDPSVELSVTQAIQIHLIEEVLRRNYPDQNKWLRRRDTQTFFINWAAEISEEDSEPYEYKETDIEAKLRKDSLLQQLMGITPFPEAKQLESLQSSAKIDTDLKARIEEQIDMSWEDAEENDFKDITTLNFRNASFENWAALFKLKYLEELTLWGSNFAAFEKLRNFPYLTVLDLDECLISDGRILTELPKLKRLYIRRSHIQNLDFLQQMPYLRTLGFSEHVTIKADTFSASKNLVSLNLSNIVTKDLNFLEQLPHVTRIFLSRSKVQDYSQIKYLKNLRLLRLGSSSISDITPLQDLHNLQKCTLPKKFEDDPICEIIRDNNPDIELEFRG
ncbi:P-loop NTPase fold protein [Terasakiella sp. SH-1]|uniref:P-loop NTPase fold protein n=1 Tax=Terasakiella sp. SH-1 TaxID=2560057 RepID=UPI0010741F7D|nr:P-loop NTPase fold protein [Terasakiella sp. SH-1]